MTPEQTLNDWIASIFPTVADVMRIECTTMNGVPDFNVCYLGTEAWIESKVMSRGLLLRKEQYAWGHRRAGAGGDVFVIGWDQTTDMIRIWKFPQITATAYDGKYVRVTSLSSMEYLRSDPATKTLVRKFVFPCF